jgi:hypothetical protein
MRVRKLFTFFQFFMMYWQQSSTFIFDISKFYGFFWGGLVVEFPTPFNVVASCRSITDPGTAVEI